MTTLADLAQHYKQVRERLWNAKGRSGKYKRWTAREDALIRELAPQGFAAIASKFPRRTVSEVRGRCFRLGVKYPRKKPDTNWRRGRLAIPKHCHPLVRQLIQCLNEQGMFISEFSKRSGIAHQTISHWRYENNPSLPLLVAAFNAIGWELVAQRIPAKEGSKRDG